MDIKLIRSRMKICSDKINGAIKEANEKENAALQDLVIWLAGYMDGMEHHEHSAMKMMVDTLSKKEQK